jgi:Rrf2 family iron-sulfur cluster assembly transcriptional regulator
MRLTTRGRYAVTAMLDLALHGDEAPVSLADIAARQDISLAYLEQIFARLRRRGLVSSVRGPGGGYRLDADRPGISVAAIVDAVDESLDAPRCGGTGDCQEGRVEVGGVGWCVDGAGFEMRRPLKDCGHSEATLVNTAFGFAPA